MTDDTELANSARALVLAQHACELTGYRDALCLDALAAAQARGGDFAVAGETAVRAAKCARSSGNTILATAVSDRIRLYEAKKACIETNPPDWSRPGWQ